MRNVKTTKTGWAPAHTRGPIDSLGSAQWLHAESALSGWVMVPAEDRHPPPSSSWGLDREEAVCHAPNLRGHSPRGPECESRVGQHCKFAITCKGAQGSLRDPWRQDPSWQKPELRKVWVEVGDKVLVLALTEKLNKTETASKGKCDAGWEWSGRTGVNSTGHHTLSISGRTWVVISRQTKKNCQKLYILHILNISQIYTTLQSWHHSLYSIFGAAAFFKKQCFCWHYQN